MSLVPRGLHALYERPAVVRALARHFNRAYYHWGMERGLWGRTWLGHTTVKYPTDMWVYQEILAEVRPEFVLETGTYKGGSALFLATVLDALGVGRILTIDPLRQEGLPEHPRISYLTGSSVDPEVVSRVRDDIGEARPVIVLLDAEHSRDHVLAELRAYADLVEAGSYVIVEDTNINGNPVLPGWGPGPREAVECFLSERDDFEVDRTREELLLTASPGGFLRRTS